MTKEQMLEALREFDTPTVSNAVATYPGKSTCLGLFHPWDTNWYTDETMRTMFPRKRPVCGYAVTCVYGIPDPNYKSAPSIRDILRALNASPAPAVLVIRQDFPERLRKKCGLLGEMMANAFYSAGCRAVVTDGPSRDLDAVEASGLQLLTTGLSPAHGPMGVKAVSTPVSVCGMDVAPGEIIHLDGHGAVKFPVDCLEQVLENCKSIVAGEQKKLQMLKSTHDAELLANYMSGVYD